VGQRLVGEDVGAAVRQLTVADDRLEQQPSPPSQLEDPVELEEPAAVDVRHQFAS
jgi:hypothetical protein